MNDCEVYCPVCGACCHLVEIEFDDDGISIFSHLYSCPECGWDSGPDPISGIGGYGWVETDQFDGGLSN